MATPNQLLNVVNAVSTAVSRLLPIVDHIPDSMGKWVAPIKQAAAAHTKLNAQIGLAAGAAKALRGRFTLVDAVMSGLNARTLGASKKMTVLSSIGQLAASKIISGFRGAKKEIAAVETKADSAGKHLDKLGRHAATAGQKAARAGKGGGGFGQGLGKVIAAVGGYRLLQTVVSGVQDSLNRGGDLLDQSTKTGIDPKSLLTLQQAAKDSGIADITGSINKMQTALVDAATNGAGPAAKALSFLGLQSEKLLKLSPVEQIQAMGAALRDVKSPELKTALVRDLFGKSGNDLLPLLDDAAALTKAEKALGAQAGILVANAAAFKEVSDQLKQAGLKLQGFFVGVAEKALPLLAIAGEKIAALDLAGMGQKFGEGIKIAGDVLAAVFADPGSMIAPFTGYLEAGFLGAGNVLLAGIMAIVPQLGAIGSALGGIFLGVSQVISGALMKAFAGPIEYLTAAIQSAFEKFAAQFARVRDELTPDGSQQGNDYRAAGDAYLTQRAALRRKLTASGDANQFGFPTTDKGRAQMALVEQSRPQSPFEGRSIAEIQKANGSFVGELGNDAVKSGQAAISAQVAALFAATEKAFGAIKVDDVLGAGAALAKANAGLAALAAKGAQILAAAVPPGAPAAPVKRNPFGKLAGFDTASSGSSLRSAGLSVASNKSSFLTSPGRGMFEFGKVANLSTARPASPILRASERRAFEDARVRAGGTRTAAGGAYNVVARGDAQRRKELAKEREREKLKEKDGVEKSNQLLAGIAESSRKTAEALAE